MTHFEGKVAIVGGNLGKVKGGKFTKGLGALIAERIASHGGKVVVTDLDAAVVQACAEALGVKGIHVDLLKDRTGHEITVDHPYRKNPDGTPKKITDVEWDDSPAHELVKQVIEEYGRVDVLVNNWDWFDKSTIEKTSSEQFDEIHRRNVAPVFHMIAAVRNQFANQHQADPNSWGKVVNVFSFVGKAGMSMASVFSAFKGSMIGLTKGLAREFGRFAIVNSVAYGPIKTQGPPARQRNITAYFSTSTDYGQKNALTPDLVANVVEFMASDASNGMCGQTVSVDMGLWLKLEQ
ncbi:MAG: glucose 1-dehydrogenase [Promethearchaeota archaeon]